MSWIRLSELTIELLPPVQNSLDVALRSKKASQLQASLPMADARVGHEI